MSDAQLAQESSEELDDLILSSARAEFEKFGIRKSNVDDVANSAGVSRSTLYRRFPNKTALLVAVAERVLLEGSGSIDAATRGFPPKATVVEAFCAMASGLHRIPFYRAVLRVNEVGKTMAAINKIRAAAADEFARRVQITLRRAGSAMSDEELAEVSYLLVNIALGMVENPIPGVAPDDERAMRRFATVHLTKLVD